MATRRKKAADVDPNRVPVKRERAEIYTVIGQLEAAKEKKAKLLRRLGSLRAIEQEIKETDGLIEVMAKRVTALLAGEPADAAKPEGGA